MSPSWERIYPTIPIYMDRTLGWTDNGNPVRCITDLVTCCTGVLPGGWYFPDGDRLQAASAGIDIIERRDAQQIDLYRRNNAIGKYRCDIRASIDALCRDGAGITCLGKASKLGAPGERPISLFKHLTIKALPALL